MKPAKVVVLGAGISGLATAWKLASEGVPVTIVEKETEAGGLAGTINWDGWRFDYGPHNFHTSNHDVVEFYQRLLPEDFVERKIKMRLFIFGNLVSYPLIGADVLLSLNGLKMAQASFDFLMTRVRAFLFGIDQTSHLDEWIIRRFGKVLYDTYFGPYIERVWKTDPHRLSKTIGELKIPILSIRNYIKREFLKKKSVNPMDLAEWKTYYVTHGIGTLSEKFLADMKRMSHVGIRMGESVKSVQLSDGRISGVETSKSSIPIGADDLVVSTIPLNALIGKMPDLPEDVRNHSDILEYCSERFLFLRIRKPKVTGYDWVYFSDKRFPFNRVAESREDRFDMVPPGCSSLTFEYPSNDTDWEWNASDEELLEKTLPLFNEVFELKRDDIIDYRTAFQKFAYPRFITGYEKVIEEIFEHLERIDNLYSIGRQGMFCYLNVDGATSLALDTAAEILRGRRSGPRHRELLKKYHRIG